MGSWGSSETTSSEAVGATSGATGCEKGELPEHAAAATIKATSPAINETGRLGYEKEDYLDYRWWSVHEIVDSPAGGQAS